MVGVTGVREEDLKLDKQKLREYYAGLAMQGLLSSMHIGHAYDMDKNWIAAQSVEYADALIKELEK